MAEPTTAARPEDRDPVDEIQGLELTAELPCPRCLVALADRGGALACPVTQLGSSFAVRRAQRHRSILLLANARVEDAHHRPGRPHAHRTSAGRSISAG